MESWFEIGDKVIDILKRHFTGKELVADSVEDLAERVMNEANRLLEEIGLCRVTGKDYDYGLIRLYVCCREACTGVDEIIINVRGDMEVKMKVGEVDVL
jgi:CMP-2-keto-3-deoxyoctulosonic acid synthetase